MKWSFLTLAALLPSMANAQELSGRVSAVDGDTLNMSGMAIRLHGIDAPEAKQTCRRAGTAWDCGEDAAQMLSKLVESKTVLCQQRDLDIYGRIIATCKIGQTDLGDAIVRAGYAVALPQFSDAYIESEDKARTLKLGIWSSEFQAPSDFRSAHRTPLPLATRPASRSPESRAVPRMMAVFYRNCDEARAAGAAPIYRGQPGYRESMDGDSDGVACEPYRGRR